MLRSTCFSTKYWRHPCLKHCFSAYTRSSAEEHELGAAEVVKALPAPATAADEEAAEKPAQTQKQKQSQNKAGPGKRSGQQQQQQQQAVIR